MLKVGRSGKCFPSYQAIKEHTGYCNETIRQALMSLEHSGLIARIRRRTSKIISRLCRITGRRVDVQMEVQTSNMYTFRSDIPAPGLELMVPSTTNRRDFPERRSLFDCLDQMLAASEKGTSPSFFTMQDSGKPTVSRPA